jgi:hypothetical protein
MCCISAREKKVARRADAGACAGPQVSRGEVDKLLDRVDVNSDGHVEFGELASALVDWRQARAPCARGTPRGGACGSACARRPSRMCCKPRTLQPLPELFKGTSLLAAADDGRRCPSAPCSLRCGRP